jgi:hypothetical protein
MRKLEFSRPISEPDSRQSEGGCNSLHHHFFLEFLMDFSNNHNDLQEISENAMF